MKVQILLDLNFGNAVVYAIRPFTITTRHLGESISFVAIEAFYVVHILVAITFTETQSPNCKICGAWKIDTIVVARYARTCTARNFLYPFTREADETPLQVRYSYKRNDKSWAVSNKEWPETSVDKNKHRIVSYHAIHILVTITLTTTQRECIGWITIISCIYKVGAFVGAIIASCNTY